MEAIQRNLDTKDFVIILTTTCVFAIIVYIYLDLLKPTVILKKKGCSSVCPTRWIYDEKTGFCNPVYPTSCKPFDPKTYHSVSEKCDIAKACGTSWKGLCE